MCPIWQVYYGGKGIVMKGVGEYVKHIGPYASLWQVLIGLLLILLCVYRLYGSPWYFQRQIQEDVVLSGYQVPKNVSLC